MKVFRQIVLLLVWIALNASPCYGQAFSTFTGGSWDAPSTWTSGAVPLTEASIVIRGPVTAPLQFHGHYDFLTVESTGSILGSGSGYATLIFDEEITNHGIIDGNYSIWAYSSLTNNGTWSNRTTELLGAADRYLRLGALRTWETQFILRDPAATMIAETPQAFSDAVLLGDGSLDMQGYPLKLYPNRTRADLHTLQGGTVIGPTIIQGVNDAVLGQSMHFDGDVTLTGDLSLIGATFLDNLTVAGNLTGDMGNGIPSGQLTVNGDLEVTGRIESVSSIESSGDISNMGLISGSSLALNGDGVRVLSQSPAARWDIPISIGFGQPDLVAATELKFSEPLWLGDLYMGNHDLLLRDNVQIAYGTIHSDADIRVETGKDLVGPADSFTALLKGNFTVLGRLLVSGGLSLAGDITVADTLSAGQHGSTLVVDGSLRNFGVIQDNAVTGAQLTLQISEDVENRRKWSNWSTELTGDADRTAYGPGITSPILVSGNITLTGNNSLPQMAMGYSPAHITVAPKASLYLADGLPADRHITNYGEVILGLTTSPGGSFEFHRTAVSLTAGLVDYIAVHQFGMQQPRGLGDGPSVYWKLESYPIWNHLDRLTLRYTVEEAGQFNMGLMEVYQSLDRGTTWRRISDDTNRIRNEAERTISVDHVSSEGLFAFSSTGSTAQEKDLALPTEIELSANYPNPFNPSTHIRFGLPVAATVRITIYDMLGRSVATVTEGSTWSAGHHSVRFDASQLATGIYIYRLTAGSTSLSGTMSLVR